MVLKLDEFGMKEEYYIEQKYLSLACLKISIYHISYNIYLELLYYLSWARSSSQQLPFARPFYFNVGTLAFARGYGITDTFRKCFSSTIFRGFASSSYLFPVKIIAVASFFLCVRSPNPGNVLDRGVRKFLKKSIWNSNTAI